MGWLWFALALAGATDESVIELVHDPGEAPTYVCILTGTGANDLFPLTSVGGFAASEDGAWFRLNDRPSWTQSGADPGVIPAALGGVVNSGPDQEAACWSDAGPACDEPDPGCCGARLALKLDPALRPDKYRIACTENVRAGPRDASALMMFVDFEQPRGFSPIIQGVRLDGNVVHLKYKSDVSSWPFPVVSVVGGDYVAGTSQVMSEGQARLSVTRRCRSHDVALPPLVSFAAGERLTLRAQLDDSPRHCTAKLRTGSRFAIALPWRQPGTAKSLSIKAATGEFRADWYDARPPVVLEAQAQAVSFAWRTHCMYASRAQSCPAAVLERHGVACEATRRDDRCEYRCSADALGFDLPTPVRFEGPNEDRWSAQLAYVGQELEGYVPPGDRRLNVDFSRWGTDGAGIDAQVRVRGDRIHYVEVASPNGSVHRVLPSGEGRQRLNVPGATCGDLLSYRLHGDRAFEEAVVAVDAGGLRFAHPRETARVVRFNLGLGAGYTAAPGATEPSLAGSAAIALRPFGIRRQQPRSAMVWFELPNVHYVLAEQAHLPLPEDLDDPSPQRHFEPFSRLFLSTLLLGRPFGDEFTVAGGPGVMVAFPVFLSENHTRYGGRNRQPAGALEVRWNATRRVSIGVATHVYPNKVRQFRYQAGGEPRRIDIWSAGASLDALLRTEL